MVNGRDIIITGTVILVITTAILAIGGLDLKGTTNFASCDIPVISQFSNQCNTEVAQKYDLDTEITIQATDANAVFNERTFEYTTTKSNILDRLNFLGPQSNLAFGGANDVTLDFQLINSEDEVIADGNKYIGELGILQSESVSFEVDNLPTGEYTVEYGLSYTQDLGITEGADYDKTLTKNIRVPKRID